MPDLAAAFTKNLEETGLIPRDARVLVAVSGGLDSVVLLHLLRFHAPAGAVIEVAHFDHRMRESSAADADWVRGLCRAWDVTCHCGVADVVPVSEAAARAARYAFLEATADATGATRIAMAHHADDQVETVLFRLLRGSGVDGLAGIPARRGRFIRPLLPFARSEVHAWAERHRLQWRDDPSNRDLRFTRNRIRHELLPAMVRVRPDARRALLRLAAEAAEARAAWNSIIERLLPSLIVRREADAIQLARATLLEYHPHVRARILRKVFAMLGPPPGRAGTRAALAFISSGTSGKAIELAGGLRLERQFERLVLRRSGGATTTEQPLTIEEPRSGRGIAVVGGRTHRVEWSVGAGTGPETALTFPSSALRFPLEVRSWQPGDRIRLAGGTKKLKKLFVERRVPRDERRRLPVLAERGGRVLWVAGLAQDAHSAPRPGEPVFRIRVTDGNGA